MTEVLNVILTVIGVLASVALVAFLSMLLTAGLLALFRGDSDRHEPDP